jgi:hypothetical protein
MVHCPNVFPLARGRHGKRERRTCVPHIPDLQNGSTVTPLPHAREACQTPTNIAPLESHRHLLFRSAEVKKDKCVGLR